jgi:hypothetical protein
MVIDAQRCVDAVEFQSAIKYHEESLSHPPFTSGDSMEKQLGNLENALLSKPIFDSRPSSDKSFRDPRSHLAGWSPKLDPPKHPMDDSNVSTRATPESKGARPCRHCGSNQHWDNECKDSKSTTHPARNYFSAVSSDEDEADRAYQESYLNATHESEHEIDSIPAHSNCIASQIDEEPETQLSDFQDLPLLHHTHCQFAKQQ